MSTTQIGVKCSCGSSKFETPTNPKASDRIRCSRCGASGTYGEVMRQATSQAKTAVEKQLKDMLRRAGFK
ncbi:hypothetical protein C7E14_18770 [Stenotrophomonas maltophilia]|uniref:ECs_2282 family putative zinc-binding protein n=1 Tax=Stenotrophomonas maltophilia TaxID=40324 RepID=UPI00092F377C|nr:hypothetical protein C7E14_18770 [Stenotrophomonas maltophilia]